MEYTELADYPVPSGRITEWIPTVDIDRWNPDDRPLSPNHQAHLEHSRRTEGHQDHIRAWIGTAFALPGPFEPATFAQTLRQWIARHDAFRTTARFAADDTASRYSVDPDAVAIDIRSADESATSAAAYRHLEKFFETEISALRWPHVVIATVEPDTVIEAAQGTIVVVGADHSVMDAYSQLLLIAEIREIYDAVRTGRAAQLPPCSSFVDYCHSETAAADSISADHPALAAWKSFWDEGTGELDMPGFPLATQPSDPAATAIDVPHQSSLSLWLLSDEETAAFNAACKQHGRSLSTGAFTALATALHRLTGSRTTRFVMPMHTRTTPESFAAAGWYVGLVPVEMTLGTATTFSDALASIDEGVRRNTALTHVPYPPLAELAGVATPPRFAVSFVDARHLPGAATWGANDRALRSRTLNHDEVYLWVNRTSEGINISLRFPSNEIAAASLHALVSEFGNVMREVATHGDLALVTSGLRAGDAHAGDAVEPR